MHTNPPNTEIGMQYIIHIIVASSLCLSNVKCKKKTYRLKFEDKNFMTKKSSNSNTERERERETYEAADLLSEYHLALYKIESYNVENGRKNDDYDDDGNDKRERVYIMN